MKKRANVQALFLVGSNRSRGVKTAYACLRGLTPRLSAGVPRQGTHITHVMSRVLDITMSST